MNTDFDEVLIEEKVNEKVYTDGHDEESLSKSGVCVFHFESQIGSGKHNSLGIQTVIIKENRRILRASQVSSVSRTQR